MPGHAAAISSTLAHNRQRPESPYGEGDPRRAYAVYHNHPWHQVDHSHQRNLHHHQHAHHNASTQPTAAPSAVGIPVAVGQPVASQSDYNTSGPRASANPYGAQSTLMTCPGCAELYPLPHGASSWRCKRCGKLNSLHPENFCCIL